LSYKLQRELDALPARITELERHVADLRNRLNEPEFYRRPHEEVQNGLTELRSVEDQLDAAIDRWGELEQQADRSIDESPAREP
jgi:ATP-binding cassette subfamily F protein uup